MPSFASPRSGAADRKSADRRQSPAIGARPAAAARRPPARGTNGLPRGLQTVMEAMSGFSLADVVVHRNSAEPARLGAEAFTKGNQVHLGPGQERHLPHEAWHVVQQAQGRVKPTLQMDGVAINDEAALEREADAAGSAAFGPSASRLAQRGVAADIGVVQMAKGKGGKNGYWFTEIHALTAYLNAIGGDAVFPIHTDVGSVAFEAGERVNGAQWVSSDMDIGGGLIFHFTLTFVRLALTKAKDGTCTALLNIKNLHGTVRSAADSRRIGEIIEEVAPLLEEDDDKKLTKKQLDLKEEYRKIQERSVHSGRKGTLKPGGKTEPEVVRQTLGLTKDQMKTGTGSLIGQLEAKLTGDFATALIGKTVTYDGEQLPVVAAKIAFAG